MFQRPMVEAFALEFLELHLALPSLEQLKLPAPRQIECLEATTVTVRRRPAESPSIFQFSKERLLATEAAANEKTTKTLSKTTKGIHQVFVSCASRNRDETLSKKKRVIVTFEVFRLFKIPAFRAGKKTTTKKQIGCNRSDNCPHLA